MATTICLMSNVLGYPHGGGMFWVYANWALGLKEIGCRVIWMEAMDEKQPPQVIESNFRVVRDRLARAGLNEIALCTWTGPNLPSGNFECISAHEASAESDLLLNLAYCIPDEVCRLFRRTALIDIDPGQLQLWMHKREIHVARHDVYFTIGEGVGQSDEIPSAGIQWHYTRPCVSLEHWPVSDVAASRGFTSVSHWYADESFEHRGGWITNDKRTAYEPYLDVPRQIGKPMELAICLAKDDQWERNRLEESGWRVRDADEVAPTPWDYQRYIQNSLAEFGCAKPSYVIQNTGWVSDRTVCYLASGRPAVVQDTGHSAYLPRREGLLRFGTPSEAIECCRMVCDDYDNQRHLARRLAEECFDARKIAGELLARALN